jgi:CRISPR-associated endonuclease/helicase Cas3
MEIIIVNLFDIDEEYCSHPNYQYKKHIQNIADSFTDLYHKDSASFHDLGKLCVAFQLFIDPNIKSKVKTTHALTSAFIYLENQNYNLTKETLSVFISILKHHGNLENVNTIANGLNDSDDVKYKNPNLIEAISEISKIVKAENNFNIDHACDYFGEDEFVSAYKFSGIDSYFNIKEVFSKLIFADKYEAIFKASYKDKPFENVDHYKEKLLKLLSSKNNDLSTVRNNARQDIIAKMQQNIDKSIFLIEAPTGIGKTFMALNLALEIIKLKNKKRLINALPMTSIIDQTFEEYSKIFDANVLMKYHHLSFSKEYYNMDKEKLNEDEFFKQKDSFINKSWAEDNVIITTFNQILNLFYSNKNRDLIKFWTLRDSVIILDEIQAIPRLLLKDFSETINFISKEFNTDFIIMSATVPDIKNYLNKSLLCELLDNKYFSLDFNNRYSLSYNPCLNSKDKLRNEIESRFKEGNSVLTVVNTKKLALEIYSELKTTIDDSCLFLLSSFFVPISRRKIISKVKKILEEKKIILISTQVVEAGVDLDFDIGFREFAPLYSIIQTAGRVNRENRSSIKNSAELIITPEIGFSPYHQTDLLKDVVKDMLSVSVRENCLLPLLKKYFEIAIKRTSPDSLLIDKMVNLEFENVIKVFDDNYMKECPNMMPVFIELEKGLYESFICDLKIFIEKLNNKDLKLEEKMEIKEEIREIYKKVSQYVINVPTKQTDSLPSFLNDNEIKDSEMKLCPNGKLAQYYDKITGWKLILNTILIF